MNPFDSLLDSLLSTVRGASDAAGSYVNLPVLIVGVILSLVAIGATNRAAVSQNGAVGLRILALLTGTAGIPLVLSSFRRGPTPPDVVLSGLLSLAVFSFMLASERGKLVKLFGIIIGMIAIAVMVSTAFSTDDTSSFAYFIKEGWNSLVTTFNNVRSQ